MLVPQLYINYITDMRKQTKKIGLRFGRRCTVEELAGLLGCGSATVARDIAAGRVDLTVISSIIEYVSTRRVRHYEKRRGARHD